MFMTLTKTEAERVFNSWSNDSPPIVNVREDYNDLRDDIVDCYKNVFEILELNDKSIQGKEYAFDLEFGIRLYTLLNNKYGFNERHASDDGIWRYFSLFIIPDIVYFRWGHNPSRFYKESRRIWIKSLWWYIHLSWQGDTENTYNILKTNTTDEVVQIVERSGPNGYRVDLCRKIMYYYGNLSPDKKKRGSQTFRRVMKLNTARTKVIEPALLIGGEEMYVKELFDYFGE